MAGNYMAFIEKIYGCSMVVVNKQSAGELFLQTRILRRTFLLYFYERKYRDVLYSDVY